jgi:hypothetical protein
VGLNPSSVSAAAAKSINGLLFTVAHQRHGAVAIFEYGPKGQLQGGQGKRGSA